MKWENLCIRFRDPRSIASIEVPDWEIEPGEVVVVSGPSGVGKSTFLKTVSGLVPRVASGRRFWPFPYSAAVCYEGEISLPPAHTHHNYTSYMPQEPPFFDGLSIFDNISLASRAQSNGSKLEPQLLDILQYLAVPHHMNTRIEILSGGERQRVAIARCLLDDTAALFCLDEPFSEMDSHNKRRAMDFIYQHSLKRKSSFLIVSHNASDLIPLATSIMVFEGCVDRVTKASTWRLAQDDTGLMIPNAVRSLVPTGEEIIFIFPEIAGKTEHLHVSSKDLEVIDGDTTSGLKACALWPGLDDVNLQTLFVPMQQITVNGMHATVQPISFMIRCQTLLRHGTYVKLSDKKGRF